VSTPSHEGALDAAGIALAPQAQGAYRLWAAGRVQFVGIATGARTLRSELLRHMRGDFGPRTQTATRFDCRVAHTAAHAHELYLALYRNSGLREAAPRLRF
jgi:hypothetical protein